MPLQLNKRAARKPAPPRDATTTPGGEAFTQNPRRATQQGANASGEETRQGVETRENHAMAYLGIVYLLGWVVLIDLLERAPVLKGHD